MILNCFTYSSNSHSFIAVRWDKDDSRSVHQSNQDSDKEKQVGESVESSLQNQVSEEKNDAGNILESKSHVWF